MAVLIEAQQDYETAILDRVINDIGESWSSEVAQAMEKIEFSPADVGRMNALAEKARQGVLSTDEEIEIESYRRVGLLLEWMKARAAATLSQK